MAVDILPQMLREMGFAPAAVDAAVAHFGGAPVDLDSAVSWILAQPSPPPAREEATPAAEGERAESNSPAAREIALLVRLPAKGGGAPATFRASFEAATTPLSAVLAAVAAAAGQPVLLLSTFPRQEYTEEADGGRTLAELGWPARCSLVAQPCAVRHVQRQAPPSPVPESETAAFREQQRIQLAQEARESKEAEARARAVIMQQIADDRAARQERTSMWSTTAAGSTPAAPKTSAAPQAPLPLPSPPKSGPPAPAAVPAATKSLAAAAIPENGGIIMMQVRLPSAAKGGVPATFRRAFPAATPLAVVLEAVAAAAAGQHVLLLSTVTREEFTDADGDRTLAELGWPARCSLVAHPCAKRHVQRQAAVPSSALEVGAEDAAFRERQRLKLAKEIREQKEAEERARTAIVQKIAEDRAERLERNSLRSSAATAARAEAARVPETPPRDSSEIQLQVRLPGPADGGAAPMFKQTFSLTTSVAAVLAVVAAAAGQPVTLLNTFPRQELTDAHGHYTLAELGLPSRCSLVAQPYVRRPSVPRPH